MRTSFRLAAVTLVIAVGLSLGGCAPDAPAPKPTASPSATPLFATDEEALAAAEEAYAAYLRVSDTITAEGGADIERIDAVVASSLKEALHDSLSKYKDRGLHTVGNSKFDTSSVQRIENDADGPMSIGLYLCLDVQGVRVISKDGTDVTPIDRVDRLPLVIDLISDDAGGLVMESSESWTGANFC